MSPGESRSFSMAFEAKADYVGTGACTIGVAMAGDPPFAGNWSTLTADTVTIEILPATEPTPSTTTDNVPTTETTVP